MHDQSYWELGGCEFQHSPVFMSEVMAVFSGRTDHEPQRLRDTEN